MMCPICLSIMYNKAFDDLKKIPPEYKLLSLHCWSNDCPAHEFGYQSHMKVKILPNKEWVCYEYHLPFLYKDKWYAMVGEPFLGYLGYPPSYPYNNKGVIPDKQTTIYHISESTIDKVYKMIKGMYIPNYIPAVDENGDIVSVPFISIPSDDSMHYQAQHLFNRLIKLAAFT